MSKENNIENYINQPDLIYGPGISEFVALNNLIDNLNRSVLDLSNKFISIGYYLKQLKDHSKFKELGYNTIYEFADENYHFSKTSTKNFIAVYEKFGNHGVSYPMISDKYRGYNFSQLVELVSVKDDLSNYSPSQTVKEIRITKLSTNLDKDIDKARKWFEVDLFNYLKEQYQNCIVKRRQVYINIEYKKYTCAMYLTNDYLINMYTYNLSNNLKSSETILACRLVKQYVDRFIKRADEEIDSISTSSTSDYVQDDVTEEVEEETSEDLEEIIEEIDNTMSGPTSDQIQVEVLDEKVHVQILKNNDQRWDYIREPSNYELIEEMSNDYVHFLKLKRTPFVRLEILVNQYEYYRDNSVKPKFTRIDNFKILDNGLFECTYRFDDRVIVDWLRENKI